MIQIHKKLPLKREFSAGAIIFFEKPGQEREYLLLKYFNLKHTKHYYDFPRGHLEKGETSEQAAKIEIKEETGLIIKRFIPGFKQAEKLFFRQKNSLVLKFITLFLAQSPTRKVKISFEHYGYIWVTAKDIDGIRAFKRTKEIIKETEAFLNNG